MTAFADMTDQQLCDAARRCVSPTYRPLAERIEKRSAEVLALVNILNEVAVVQPSMGAVARARALLERLEDDGTMAALRRPKRGAL